MSENHTCPTRVKGDGYFSGHACGRKAAYEHDGKLYCKTHHPPTIKAKVQARTEAWHAEWKQNDEKANKAQVARAEIERRASHFDELLKALQLAVRQNSHDMLMTGEELRECNAAINKATGGQA